MLPNIGVDLLHLPRIAALVARRGTYMQRFARRILSDSEMSTFSAKMRSGEDHAVTRWLGVRWAAKEAAFKAGGAGRRLMWKEVEVRYMSSGKCAWNQRATAGVDACTGQPYLQIPGEGITGSLSISHDGDYVVAMAMLPAFQQMAAAAESGGEDAVAVHG